MSHALIRIEFMQNLYCPSCSRMCHHTYQNSYKQVNTHKALICINAHDNMRQEHRHYDTSHRINIPGPHSCTIHSSKMLKCTIHIHTLPDLNILVAAQYDFSHACKSHYQRVLNELMAGYNLRVNTEQ